MKKPTDNLSRLIRAMTHGEKKAFRLFTKRYVRGEENIYLKLYDLIDRQKQYNEDPIKREMAKWMNIRNLSVEKNFLYNLLSKSLILYHSEKSAEELARGQLSLVKIFHRKCLYAEALQALKRAKKIAKEYQLLDVMLSVSDYEQRIKRSNTDKHGSDSLLHELVDEEEAVLKAYMNYVEYRRMGYELYDVYIQIGQKLNPGQLKSLNKVTKSRLFRRLEPDAIFSIKLVYYKTLCLIGYLEDDVEKHLRNACMLVKTWEDDPKQIDNDPHNYIASLNIALGGYVAKRDSVNIQRVYEEIHSRLNKKEYNISKAFAAREEVSAFINLCDYYNSVRQFSTVLRFGQQIGNDLKLYSRYTPPYDRILLCYMLAYMYFGLGEFRISMKWINQIIHSRNFDSFRRDIHIKARILNLVIHYELNNYDTVLSLGEGLLRYLEKIGGAGPIEEKLISSIKKLALADNNSDTINYLNELKIKLLEEKVDYEKKDYKQQLNILEWIESKLSGISFNHAG